MTKKDEIKHCALIPAKKKSNRCINKNWRRFTGKDCLVDFTLKTIPKKMFNKIIVSTDRIDYNVPSGIELHLRHRKLATKKSSINDLIQLIIERYRIGNKDYLWLLNPTSPFRTRNDYRRIKKIIEASLPTSLISGAKIHPFIWKGKTPLFQTKGKRRNTEDFREECIVENGMFYVMNIGYFRKKNSWYSKNTKLYAQDTLWGFIDIDTEKDFKQAQNIAKFWKNER